jgi:pimeloyl-ACP methyl ester carboxylesterase
MKHKNSQAVLRVGIIGWIILLYTGANCYSQISQSNVMNQLLKMQCQVHGEGSPLVLVGGGLTGWKSWEPFVPFFTAKQRKVILVQLLNVQYGLEGRPLPKDYSVKTESNALAETLDSLELTTPFDVVAWSYGAFTSLEYALDHNDRIRTLTLIEPPAMWILRQTGQFGTETKQTAAFFQAFQGDITEDMLADFLVHAGLVPTGQQPREVPQWNSWVPYRQSLRNNPYVVLFNDTLERLKKFQPPVLLVKGTGSTQWLHRVIDGLSANLPHAKVVEFPGGMRRRLHLKTTSLKNWKNFKNSDNCQWHRCGQ